MIINKQPQQQLKLYQEESLSRRRGHLRLLQFRLDNSIDDDILIRAQKQSVLCAAIPIVLMSC